MKGSDPTKPSGREKASSTRARLDCATAFEKIGLDCVAKVKAHHGGACAGEAEAVHQIRVAITRLRAAVSFFASITADAEWRRLKKEIAWLNASLGAARDSDVVLEYARRKRYRAWAQSMTPQYLDAHQARDHRRLSGCLHSMRFQDLIEAMSAWIERGPWRRRWERNNRHEPAKQLKAYSRRELNRWRRRLIGKGRRLETPARRAATGCGSGQSGSLHAGGIDGHRCGVRSRQIVVHRPQGACNAQWATFAISSASPRSAGRPRR
jgi:inorganic triphosphatase YgiF